jgi:hypothetical protein
MMALYVTMSNADLWDADDMIDLETHFQYEPKEELQ